MKVWQFYIFLGIFILSAESATAGDLSANPWLKKNSAETKDFRVTEETSNSYSPSVKSEDNSVNPWGQNNKNTSDTVGNRLKQELKSAAENSQRNLQNLSEEAHRLATLSLDTSHVQEGEALPNIVEKLSDWMRNKQQPPTTADTHLSYFDYTPTFNSKNGRRRYNNVRQESFSLGTRTSQTYRWTTDKFKRSIRSKYNAVQRQIEPYANSAHNALRSWEKNSGVTMEQLQKIMH